MVAYVKAYVLIYNVKLVLLQVRIRKWSPCSA